MQTAVRILMLEDQPEDAALITRELRRAGLRFEATRVESRHQFLREIEEHRPDVILSDHGLPSFDGIAALVVARQQCPDVPFIFVTGALGEEFAIKSFESGATDYVLKHHLSDLAPAIRRSLDLARDLREQRERERDLRRNEESFRLLVESVTDYAIYLLDAEGRIITWNHGAERIEGYQADEVIGQPFSAVFPQDEVIAGKPGRILEQARAGGRYEEEGWRLRQNGERYWCKVIITAIRNDAGELQGFSKVAHDLTEQRHYEQALQRSEARMRTVLDTALDAIVLMDGEGLVQEWNDAAERMFAYARSEAVGRPLADLIIPPYLRDAFWRQLARYVVEGSGTHVGQRVQTYAVRKDGTEFPVEVALTASTGRERPFFTGYIADITERKRAQEEIQSLNADLESRVARRTAQLEAANKELEAFSYSVSHDLRAPLRHINGFVGILQSTADGVLSEEQRGYLETIADSARQMGKLIDDLLAFSRMGRTELRFVPVKLDNVIAEARKELRHEAENRVVHWNIGPMPEVVGDNTMLRQVFINLLSNALKYTRHRAEAVIEIQSQDQDGEHVISVRDNGVGFDNAYANKLFGVFQRLHPAQEFEGTGIGLAIVRRVIARHGGRVWADGQTNQGAAFYITLPEQTPETVPA